ncbi:hypothetical protein GP486_008766, partial [Trichoglossum hirsutum]
MAIIITPPAPAAAADYGVEDSSSEGEEEDGQHGLGGRSSGAEIVTPGETITEDPQWMR